MKVFKAAVLGAVLAAVPGLGSAVVNPATQTFLVTLTINKECFAGSISDLAFPAQGYLTSLTIDAQTNITYGCTKGTAPTAITLNNGAHGADAGCTAISGTRCMNVGSDYVKYGLFTDASRSTPWPAGGVAGTAGTGALNGANPDTSTNSVTVYGRVPAQATPTPGNYTDTVTVSIAF